MTDQRPTEGAEKDCKICGAPALFHERPLKRSQATQIRDYIPAAAEHQSEPGWVCTENENHFEPLTK